MSEGDCKKLYECSKCEFKSAKPKMLSAHKAKSHVNFTLLNCTHCNRKFRYDESLKKHLQKHTAENPYVCKFCKARFAQFLELNRHIINVHRKVKPLPCPICKDNSEDVVEEGDDKQPNDDLHRCKMCRCRFKDAESLETHVRVHSREKPFLCDFCGAKFIQRSDIIVHLRYHTGERPFVCLICGSKFVRKMHLKSHMKTTHSDKRPFNCDQCESNFKTSIDLRAHVKRIHNSNIIPKPKTEKKVSSKSVRKGKPKTNKLENVKSEDASREKSKVLISEKTTTDKPKTNKLKKIESENVSREKSKTLISEKTTTDKPKTNKLKKIESEDVSREKSKTLISEEKRTVTDFKVPKSIKVIYKCIVCKAIFKEIDTMKTHIKFHIKEKLTASSCDIEAKPTRFELD